MTVSSVDGRSRERSASRLARNGQAVLLVGNYVPSLAAARALGRSGLRVIVGDGGEYATVRYSRYCRKVWRHPPITDPEAFRAALVAFLSDHTDVTMILPLQERYVAFLTRARRELPEGVIVAAPDASVVETCLDRKLMHEIAVQAGVPSHPVVQAQGLVALEAAVSRIGYPCVIRPSDHRTGHRDDRKVIICWDRAALDALLSDWPVQPGPMLVQRYVPGPRHNIYFIAKDGRILSRLETRVIRTDRLDGTGLAVEEAVVPTDARLEAFCDALLDRLGYSGIGSAQFIVPGGGEPSFLEINPRHDAAAAGPEAFGLPLTLGAIGLSSVEGTWLPDPSPLQAAGRHFAWTSRDLYGLGMAISRHEVGARAAIGWLAAAIRAAFRADAHLTWSWRDPLPTWAVYLHLATLGPWRRARRSLHGSAARPVPVEPKGRRVGQQPRGDDAP